MLAKCTRCHHEWQQAKLPPKKCDWCGEDGEVIAADYMDDPTTLFQIVDRLIRKELGGKVDPK